MLKNDQEVPETNLLPSSQYPQYSIDNFIEACEQKKAAQQSDALLQDLLLFANELKRHPLYWFKQNAQDPAQGARKIRFYYHPDKYDTFFPQHKESDTHILVDAFRYLTAVIKALDAEKNEPQKLATSTIDKLDSAKKLEVMMETENACFSFLKNSYHDLSNSTRRFLLRTYGRIISLTFYLAVHYKHTTNLSESMQHLDTHIHSIKSYLVEMGLLEEFEKALTVSFVETGNQDARPSLDELRQSLITAAEAKEENDQLQQKKKQRQIATRLVVSVVISTSISLLTSGFAIPFFIPGIIATLGASMGEVAASEQEQRATLKFRERYFDIYFQGIVNDLDRLHLMAAAESKYQRYLNESSRLLTQADRTIYNEIEQKLPELSQHASMNLNDAHYLHLFENIRRQLKEKFNQSGFSDAEKERLQLFGIDPNVCVADAEVLRALLSMEFNEGEQRKMRSTALAGLLEDHAGVSGRLLLMDYPQREAGPTAEEKVEEITPHPTTRAACLNTHPAMKSAPMMTTTVVEEVQRPDTLTPREQERLHTLGIETEGLSEGDIQVLRELLAIEFNEKETDRMYALKNAPAIVPPMQLPSGLGNALAAHSHFSASSSNERTIQRSNIVNVD